MVGLALVLGRDRFRHRWELRGELAGRDVLLYSTTDTRVFNQVIRALRRAMELNRPPSLFDQG